MAACHPPPHSHLHMRAAPSRGRLFNPDPLHFLSCQVSSPSKSFVSFSCIDANSNICLREGSTVEAGVSDLTSDYSTQKPSIRFHEVLNSQAENSAQASTRHNEGEGHAFLDKELETAMVDNPPESRIRDTDEACTCSSSPTSCTTSISFTTTDMSSSSSSVLASSDGAETLPSTFPVYAQTRDRSKVVRTAWEALRRWSRSWRLLNARKATNVLERTSKVVVLGGGSFGTAMAVLLARNKAEMQVSLLIRDTSLCEAINNEHVNRKYFPKHVLPHNIVATTDSQEAFRDAQFCIHAVPVQYSADFLKSVSGHVPPSLPFFSVSKGLELSSLEMMSQVIPRALGNQRQPIAVISGPSFSIELMDELPTAMVVASKDKELARSAQQLLASRYLRINTSSDVVGVEIAGALKNVLAIAAGIVEGMNLGNNCMAALVAQGCSEIRWLAEKMGAKSTTLAGLSGTGDIMLTCFVSLSRNRSVGVRLGSGESLGDILSSMNQVAEGVATAGAVITLARKYRVQMPVLTAVARILENELTPKKAVLELMSLPQVEEV